MRAPSVGWGAVVFLLMGDGGRFVIEGPCQFSVKGRLAEFMGGHAPIVERRICSSLGGKRCIGKRFCWKEQPVQRFSMQKVK